MTDNALVRGLSIATVKHCYVQGREARWGCVLEETVIHVAQGATQSSEASSWDAGADKEGSPRWRDT